MRSIIHDVRAVLTAIFVLTVVCAIVFPAVVWGFARLFPDRAHGSLLTIHGLPRGSRLLGQGFTAPRYFHSRPSAAGGGYDATSSGGSNLPPSSRALGDLIAKRASDYRVVNGLPPNVPVPADALTASASGLDPHISPENAAAQTDRVARARGVTSERVAKLVAAQTDGPTLGVIGRPRVNVLMLNLALDRVMPISGVASDAMGEGKP
jgi:K+-transporting ATPase ATPase C chain